MPKKCSEKCNTESNSKGIFIAECELGSENVVYIQGKKFYFSNQKDLFVKRLEKVQEAIRNGKS
jgi:hypothetical protein